MATLPPPAASRPVVPALALPVALALLAALQVPAHAAGTTPAGELARWSAMAGRSGDAARGEAFFNARHGGEWSCASCHGRPPTGTGRHAATDKAIAPLAPAFEPTRFTDAAHADKWFRRNCRDVLARECTPAEKADVLAYLTQWR